MFRGVLSSCFAFRLRCRSVRGSESVVPNHDASEKPESHRGLPSSVAILLVLSFISADGNSRSVLQKYENSEPISLSCSIQDG